MAEVAVRIECVDETGPALARLGVRMELMLLGPYQDGSRYHPTVYNRAHEVGAETVARVVVGRSKAAGHEKWHAPADGLPRPLAKRRRPHKTEPAGVPLAFAEKILTALLVTGIRYEPDKRGLPMPVRE